MPIPRRLPRVGDTLTVYVPELDRSGIAYWERYALAHPELDENTNVGCARPSIDHGRLLTLERREKLAQLEAVLRLQEPWGPLDFLTFRIENRALLSPRRIYRQIRSVASRGSSAEIADALYALIRDWVEAGYPTPDHPADLGMPPRTIYKSRVRAWSIYLTRKA